MKETNFIQPAGPTTVIDIVTKEATRFAAIILQNSAILAHK
jgi:hypothetical protein